MPIRYVNQGYPRAGLSGFYRAADVALVTPLRDGMNLVAKEYVAAQDPDDPGVLILSRFAGAAHQLGEALLVNPYSKDEISRRDPQGARHAARRSGCGAGEALIENVRREDVLSWRRAFVDALQGKTAPLIAEPVPA